MRILIIIRKAILLCSLFIIVSCTKTGKKFEFEVSYSKNIKVKKDSVQSLYLKIYNLNNQNLDITNIKSSCNCIVLSKKAIEISPNVMDSIKIELHGSSLGVNYERIVFSNDKNKKFKLTEIRYEVTE